MVILIINFRAFQYWCWKFFDAHCVSIFSLLTLAAFFNFFRTEKELAGVFMEYSILESLPIHYELLRFVNGTCWFIHTNAPEVLVILILLKDCALKIQGLNENREKWKVKMVKISNGGLMLTIHPHVIAMSTFLFILQQFIYLYYQHF